jgi:hypothetical protein
LLFADCHKKFCDSGMSPRICDLRFANFNTYKDALLCQFDIADNHVDFYDLFILCLKLICKACLLYSVPPYRQRIPPPIGGGDHSQSLAGSQMARTCPPPRSHAMCSESETDRHTHGHMVLESGVSISTPQWDTYDHTRGYM